MQTSKTVNDFLTRTNSKFKYFCFSLESDDIVNVSVAEAASLLTQTGGKLKNKSLEQVAQQYAKLKKWTIVGVMTK